MFAKSTILVACLAVSARLATAAAPPACLLGAVNTQPSPSDMESICGDKSSEVEEAIKSLCGANTDAAMTAFTDACSAAGNTVETSSSTSSSSSSASMTDSSMSSMSTGSLRGSNSTGSMVMYTTTYSDSSCSCTKTAVIGATASGVSGFVTSTPTTVNAGPTAGMAGPNAANPGSASPTTGGSRAASPSTSPPPFQGAASRTLVGSFAAAAVAALGFVVVM